MHPEEPQNRLVLSPTSRERLLVRPGWLPASRDLARAVGRSALDLLAPLFGIFSRPPEGVVGTSHRGQNAPVRLMFGLMVGGAVALARSTGSPVLGRLGVVLMAALAFGIGLVALRLKVRNRLIAAAWTLQDGDPDARALSATASSWGPPAIAQTIEAIGLLRNDRGWDAAKLLCDADPARLSIEERRIYWGVRALSHLQCGDKRDAHRAALLAFPTGIDPIDEPLAEQLLESASGEPMRALALIDSWMASGVAQTDDDPVGAVVRYAQVKLSQLDPRALGPSEIAEMVARADRESNRELSLKLRALLPTSQSYR